jgi:molybdopterin converting factor small subunit
MRKLSLDISTRSTGIVIQNDNELPVEYFNITITEGDALERIRGMCSAIFKYIENKKFDIIIVSKATHQFSQQIIMLIEGMVLGEAVKRNIKFDYFPDVAWYSKVQGANVYDKRRLKKRKSIRQFFIRHKDIITRNHILKVDDKGDKIFVHLKNGDIITDDIADAFNASDLYEKRIIDYKMKMAKSKLQEEINKLAAINKKIRRRMKLLKQRIKFWSSEKKEFEKEHKVKGGKRPLFSARVREERIKSAESEFLALNAVISANLKKMEEKRERKR